MQKRHIVTKASECGTFQVGDHIMFWANGNIECREGEGFLLAEKVPAATVGMESKPDVFWAAKRKTELFNEILWLNGVTNEIGDNINPLHNPDGK